jgi:hypothetical protein
MARDNEFSEEKTSFTRRTGDLPVRVSIAINETVKSFSDFFGSDNSVSKLLSNNVQWYSELLSAQALENDEEVSRILEEAKDKGMLDSLSHGLKAFTVAPADFLASGVGSLLPFLAGGALAKVAGLGYMGAGLTQSGLAGAVQIGAVKGGIYDEIKSELVSQGITEEEAKAQALASQSYGGGNTDQIAIAGLLGMAGGRVGAHRAITRGLFRGGFSACREKVAMVAKEGLWEGGIESLQGGHEKAAENISLRRTGVDTDILSGVGANAALEGTIGVFLGGGMAGVEPRVKQRATSLPKEQTLTDETEGRAELGATEIERDGATLQTEKNEEYIILPKSKTSVGDGDSRTKKPAIEKQAEEVGGRGEGADKFSVSKVSPGKQKALGLQDNPLGVFLVASQPQLFQGVGTHKQYQEKLTQALDKLEKDIDGGKYLNTAYDAESHERLHKIKLSKEEVAVMLQDHRRNQESIQQGWKQYLSEGGYGREQRLLILFTIVKEVAVSERGNFRVHQLGGKSNRLPPVASPETAGIFFDKFKGDRRPSIVLREAEVEQAGQQSERLRSFSQSTHATEWGGSITWHRFERGEVDPEGVTQRSLDLATLSKTVDQFGLTSWCCSGERIAENFILKGDFWVGVDERGRARVSLRLDGEKDLQEISGVLPGQSLEPKFAGVVTQLIEERGIKGGQRWVEDAVLKGKIAEMKKPGDWEEFKEIIEKKDDQEALKFFREYRGPKGPDDFLVGVDNAELNQTLWEKTKDDGGDTPLDQALRRGQFSQAMRWIDHSMLDSPRKADGQQRIIPTTHGYDLFSNASGVQGADLFKAMAQSGYLTPERQMQVGGRGLPMMATAAFDTGKVKLMAEFEGLIGDSLKVPNVDGDNGILLTASNPANLARECLEILSQRGILTGTDQYTENNKGENLFAKAGAYGGEGVKDGISGNSLSLMVGQNWIDHNALFTPSKHNQTIPLSRIGEREGDLRAVAYLRDHGHLTPERQRHVDAEGNNIIHQFAGGWAIEEVIDWQGLDKQALRTPNRQGKTPLEVYLGNRLASEGKMTKIAKHLDTEMLFAEYEVPNGETSKQNESNNKKRSESLIFPVARAEGLIFLLSEGFVTPAQVTEAVSVRGGKQHSPWHAMPFPSDDANINQFDKLVENGTITPQTLLLRDGDGLTVAGSWVQSSNHCGRLFSSPVLTKEVRMSRDPDGKTFGHHVAKGYWLAQYLGSDKCGREEIEAVDNNGNTLLHSFAMRALRPDSLSEEKIGKLLRVEDFLKPNNDGDIPSHKFIENPNWMRPLISQNLVNEAFLTQENTKTGLTALDLIPQHYFSETFRILAEAGLVSRNSLLREGSKSSLYSRFTETIDRSSQSLAEGFIFLNKHCDLKASDIKANEIHTIIHRTKPHHVESSEIRALAEAGLVDQNVLYEADGHNPPVIFGTVTMRDQDWKPNTEAFRALSDNGLIPPSRLGVREQENGITLAGKLLDQAEEYAEWKGEVLRIIEGGGFNREALFDEYVDSSKKTKMVGDMLFASGNETILQKCIDEKIVKREDFSEGGRLLKGAIERGAESLRILAKNNLIKEGDLGKVEIETWRGKLKGGQYLFEEKPEIFSILCEERAINLEDVLSEKVGTRGDTEGVIEQGIAKGKLKLLEQIPGIEGLKLGEQEVDKLWFQAGLSKGTGELVTFFRKTGMSNRQIQSSLTTPGSTGSNNLTELAKLGGDRLIPLIETGIVGRKELLNQPSAILRGGDRDALNAVIRSSPESWASLLKSGVLERGDLFRNQSLCYASPVRSIFSSCDTPEQEKGLANTISKSGILLPEEGSQLAVALSRGSQGGAALETFILSGDIRPQDLSQTVANESALDLLIKRRQREGPQTLKFLRDQGVVTEQDLPRVLRAISGEFSPLRDKMDSIAGKLHRLLGVTGRTDEGLWESKKNDLTSKKLSRGLGPENQEKANVIAVEGRA